MPATSEPPPGSVTASEPIISPASVGRTNRSTRSGEPCAARCGSAMPPVNSAAISPLDAPGLEDRLLDRDRVEQVAALAADRLREADAEQPLLRGGRGAARAAPRRRPPTPAGAAPPRGARTRPRGRPSAPSSLRGSARSQQRLLDVDDPRAEPLAERPWPAGRTGSTRRRPAPSSPWTSDVDARRGWAARRPRRRGRPPRAAARAPVSGVISLVQPGDARVVLLRAVVRRPRGRGSRRRPCRRSARARRCPSGIRRVSAVARARGTARAGGRHVRLATAPSVGRGPRPPRAVPSACTTVCGHRGAVDVRRAGRRRTAWAAPAARSA